MEIQKFSYHTHTDFSDGKNTLDEMLTQAVKLGWEEIGVSDHIIIHEKIRLSSIWESNRKSPYRVKYYESFEEFNEDYRKRISEVRTTAKKHPIKVYMGGEIDFFTYDGWLEKLKGALKDLDFDYLHSGNHFAFDDKEIYKVDYLHEYGMSLEEQRVLFSNHFKTIKKAIESGIFSFIAHLDYARLSQTCSIDDFKEERMEIIEALAQTKTPFELSTKGLRSLGDFYPALWMLQELKKRDVPVVISDDAHRLIEIGQDFERAEGLLENMGYKNRWRLIK